MNVADDVLQRATTPMAFSFRPGEHPEMRVFHREDGHKAHGLLAVAFAAFELEKELRRRSVDRLAVHLPPNGVSWGELPQVATILNELVSFALVEDVDFGFERAEPLRARKLRTEIDLAPSEAVCLFSGGIDSTIGLALTEVRFDGVDAVFCAHQDQSKINRLVRSLYGDYFEPRGTRLRILSVPGIGKGSYAQLRGFLYFVSAAAWAKLLDASALVVTECGPTMYQPKFGPLDRVTLTTHPLVVETSKRVIETFLQRPIRIVTPFEDLTKAEVMALAPEKLPLAKAHSCVSQRFSGQKQSHDGVCYGCVVRRLAALAADVPDTDYAKDPLVDESASRGNLLSLLRFCLDYLIDPARMAEYEVGEIEAYGKLKMFRRFALDNYAAIHRLVRAQRPLAQDVAEMYSRVVEALGGSEALDTRLEVLARGDFKPAF